MFPFLTHGDAVIVYKFSYVFKSPQINDVIIIKNPEENKSIPFIIKRITKLQNRQLYVVGDNKDVSHDSRHFGWIDQKLVRGKMIKKL